MNTFTKSLAPSFRMSYMVLPKHLMISYRELSSYHSCTVPTFEQYVLHKFMKEGYFERHIHRMSQRYREKLEKIITIINTYPNLKIHGFETGLHFLLEIHTDEIEAHMIDRLKAHNINLTLLDSKSKNLYPYPTLIIGYSGIPIESIENHMKQLIDVIFKKK